MSNLCILAAVTKCLTSESLSTSVHAKLGPSVWGRGSREQSCTLRKPKETGICKMLQMHLQMLQKKNCFSWGAWKCLNFYPCLHPKSNLVGLIDTRKFGSQDSAWAGSGPPSGNKVRSSGSCSVSSGSHGN